MDNVINVYFDSSIESKVCFEKDNESKTIIYNELTNIIIYIEDSDTKTEYNSVKKIKLYDNRLEIYINDNNTINKISGSYIIEMVDYNYIVLDTKKEYSLSLEVKGPNEEDCIGITMYIHPDNTYKKALFCYYCGILSASSVIAKFFEDSSKIKNILSNYYKYEYIYINGIVYILSEIADYDLVLIDLVTREEKMLPYLELANSQAFMFSKNDIIITDNHFLIRDGKIIATVEYLGNLFNHDFKNSDLFKIIDYKIKYDSLDYLYISESDVADKIVLELNNLIKEYSYIFEKFNMFENDGRLLYFYNKTLYELHLDIKNCYQIDTDDNEEEVVF